MRLHGKIALITGIGSGQGRAAARLFAKEGGHVIGCDIDEAELSRTVSLTRDEGGKIDAVGPVDLADPIAVQTWIDEAANIAGGFDILYNNAAAARFGSILETSVDDWCFTMRREIDLIFFAAKAAWPHLIARRGGTIINTASAAGYFGTPTVPAGAHIAAKGAVIAYTRQLAAEGAEHNIRANSISPGAIETPALALLTPEQKEAMSRQYLLGRIGQPEDIAYCALYLASDAAAWVTGSDFTIDGGLTAVLR